MLVFVCDYEVLRNINVYITLPVCKYPCDSSFKVAIITASQMWIFSTLLPLMIGDLVPEDDQKWECFLLLLDIVKQELPQPKQLLLLQH